MLFCLILGLVFTLGCNNGSSSNGPSANASNSNRIVAISYPLQFITQEIVGPEIQVDFPTPAGENPMTWQPATEAVLEMQNADLIVTNGPGAHYANWMVHFTLPESKICKTTADLPLSDYMQIKDHQIVHSHGPEGEHSHAYMVPYTWLDPNVLERQAEKVADSIGQVYPERVDQFHANLKALKNDLAAAEKRAAAIAEAQKESPLYAIHLNPNTRMATRASGFRGDHLLYFGDESDPDENAVRFNQLVAKEKPRLLIVDRDSIPEPIKAVAVENGIEIIRLDLMDHSRAEGFLDAMNNNFELLKNALASE